MATRNVDYRATLSFERTLTERLLFCPEMAVVPPWQTLWKRHARFNRDGTWDRIHVHLLA